MAKKDKHHNKNNKKNKGPFGGGPNPNSKVAKEREFERLLQRSEKLWRNGDSEGAIDILEDLRERDPDDTRPVVLLGVVYTELGETTTALDYLRLADRMEPDSPRILSVLSTVLMLSDRPSQALETLRHFREIDRKSEVFSLTNQEQLTAIEEILRQLAKEVGIPFQDFAKAQLLVEQAHDAEETNDNEQALSFLEQARKIAPKWADPALVQAQLFYDSGEADKSIETLRLILDDIDPNSPTTLSRLILLLNWRGQTEESVALLPRLNDVFEKQVEVKVKPQSTPQSDLTLGSPLLYSLIASCFGINGDHQRAYDIMRQGEEAGIEYEPDGLIVAGVAAYNLGKTEEADKYWQILEEDEEVISNGYYQGLMQAIERPRPADSAPLELPYQATALFVPLPILSKVIVMKQTSEIDEYGDPKIEFDNEAMRANYATLNPLYNLQRALVQNIYFGLSLNAETQIGIMSDVRTPELIEALKQIAAGYLGAESARRYAVAVLQDGGELPKEGTFRFWVEAEAQWKDLQLSSDFLSQADFEMQMVDDILGHFDHDDEEENSDDDELEGV